jgi:hypothetical protein
VQSLLDEQGDGGGVANLPYRAQPGRRGAFAAGDFPGYMAPVVRCVDGADRELVMLPWGFVLLQQGKARRARGAPSTNIRLVTNVRDDKVLSSRLECIPVDAW